MGSSSSKSSANLRFLGQNNEIINTVILFNKPPSNQRPISTANDNLSVIQFSASENTALSCIGPKSNSLTELWAAHDIKWSVIGLIAHDWRPISDNRWCKSFAIWFRFVRAICSNVKAKRWFTFLIDNLFVTLFFLWALIHTLMKISINMSNTYYLLVDTCSLIKDFLRFKFHYYGYAQTCKVLQLYANYIKMITLFPLVTN